MTKYCVLYKIITEYESVVDAKSYKEARKKVKEVVGPFECSIIWEIKDAEVSNTTTRRVCYPYPVYFSANMHTQDTQVSAKVNFPPVHSLEH